MNRVIPHTVSTPHCLRLLHEMSFVTILVPCYTGPKSGAPNTAKRRHMGVRWGDVGGAREGRGAGGERKKGEGFGSL